LSDWVVLLVSLPASSVGIQMYIWFFSVGYGLSSIVVGRWGFGAASEQLAQCRAA